MMALFNYHLCSKMALVSNVYGFQFLRSFTTGGCSRIPRSATLGRVGSTVLYLAFSVVMTAVGP